MDKQADFYILSANTSHAREGFLIKLLGKIQSKGLRVLILVDNEVLAVELDKQLWDHRPDTFLPHHIIGTDPSAFIGITHQKPNLPNHDVLVNFSTNEKITEDYPRVVEVVIQEDSTLNITRKRYQQYREQQWTLNRHDLRKP